MYPVTGRNVDGLDGVKPAGFILDEPAVALDALKLGTAAVLKPAVIAFAALDTALLITLAMASAPEEVPSTTTDLL